MVARPGLEPGTLPPKGSVIPFHHRAPTLPKINKIKTAIIFQALLEIPFHHRAANSIEETFGPTKEGIIYLIFRFFPRADFKNFKIKKIGLKVRFEEGS